MGKKKEIFGQVEGLDVEAYRNRLRIMREVISGENQTEFAKRLGIDFKRWSNYERGYPVPREVAFLLHHKFPGMSIEWLWFGSMTSLSPVYRDKIQLAYKLDVERNRDLAEMEKIRCKLNASAEKRKKVLTTLAKRPARRKANEANERG